MINITSINFTTKKYAFGLASLGVLLAAAFLGFVSSSKAATSDLEVYTEVSKVSDPAWKRTVTVSDLMDEVKFKINVKNLGSDELDDVVVKFEPAAGFEFADGQVTVTKKSGPDNYDASLLVSDSGLNIGSLEAWDETSDYAEVIFKVRLAYCPWTDTYRSGIKVDSAQTEEVIDQVDVTIGTKCQDVVIEKLVSNTNRPEWKKEVSAAHSDYVQYKIKISNPNPLPVTEVRVKDTLPDGLTLRKDTLFLVFDGKTMSPNSGNGDVFGDGYLLAERLDPFESEGGPYWEVTYKARVGDCPVEGKLANKGEAWTKWEGRSSDSATVVVETCPVGEEKLTIEKFVRWSNKVDWYGGIEKDQHMFGAGDNVYYRIMVKNTGDGDAEKVTVVDSQPEYIKWVSGDGQWDNEIDRKVTFDLGTLKAGDEAELLYMSEVVGEVPTEDTKQENTAVLYRDRDRIDDNSSFIWIHGPEAPEVLAGVTELPVSGGDATGLILVSLGMIISGWGMRRLVLSF